MMGRSPGLVTLAILNAIREGRVYGADIVQSTGLGGGTIYKTLSRLEKRGWIVGSWEAPEIAEAEKRPRRRFYRLTSDGEAATTEALERARQLTRSTALDAKGRA
jgi:DNA-binding PadR family transcriptional regulator